MKMSRKKNKKMKVVEAKVISTEKTSDEAKTPPVQSEALPPPPPSKREQLSNMLFNDFLKKNMKIFNYIENQYITIIPYMEKDAEEKEDGSDIVCYEITPSSNKEVTVYVDNKDLCVSLKGEFISLDDAELTYLAANILGYVRKYSKIAA